MRERVERNIQCPLSNRSWFCMADPPRILEFFADGMIRLQMGSGDTSRFARSKSQEPVANAHFDSPTEPDSNHQTETSASSHTITSGAASQRQQRVWQKSGLHAPKSCGHRCRAGGRKRDAHRLGRSRKSFADNGISCPLSLPAHKKTPRSLATCDRRALVE